MGTCCTAHLATKVKAYALDAQNGAVTVKPLDVLNPSKCDYCQAPAEYSVSYYPKPQENITITAPSGSITSDGSEWHIWTSSN